MPDAPIHSPPSAWRCIRRALHLRCPECGLTPIFVSARRVRSLYDWLTPLDGCPHCGYAYEREPGYFLLAVWGLNYGLVAGIGVLVGLFIQNKYNPGLWSPMWLWLLPMPFASFLFARHAKALFLAMDHYFDPHVKPSAQHDSSPPLDDDQSEYPNPG